MATRLAPGQVGVIALSAIVAVLAVVILWETQWGASLHEPLPQKPLAAPAAVEPKLLPVLVASAPEQAWPETGARPLFVPGRRPAPALNAPAAMRKGQFILQGTTIVGPLSIAMFKEVSSGKVFRIEKGKELLGMTLAEVGPASAKLQSGDDFETLQLLVTKAPPAPQAAAQPAAQAGPFASSAPGPGPVPAVMPVPPTAAAGGPPVPMPPTGRPVGMPAAPGAPGGAASTAPPPTAGQPNITPDMTPEEMLARRRAARRAQQQ